MFVPFPFHILIGSNELVETTVSRFARRRLNGENLEGKHADDLAIALVSHMQDATL